MKFYGRTEELKTFESEFSNLSSGSRLAVITGRRRVGKTTLILKACQQSGLPYLYFFVQRKYSEQELASEWLSQVRQQFNLTEDDGPARLKLTSVIRFVMQKSADQPIILVIDECQELDFISESFWSELQQIWDLNKNSSKLMLIMSGSVASALKHIFGSISEPLYGRMDLTLTVEPFSPNVLTEIFQDIYPKGKPEDLLALFALTGGVARYVEILSSIGSFKQNDMLSFVFSPSGSAFRSDGDVVLANEFRIESSIYYSLLRAIASGVSKWSELQNVIPGQIGPYLNRLEGQYNLIERVYPLGSISSRNVRYSVSDEYFRFWFRFIDTPVMKNLAESQQWSLMQKLCKKDFETFSGRCLESWFRKQYSHSGQWTEVGTWWDKKGENEIDLVALNSLEKKIEIVEIKRQKSKINEHLLAQKAKNFLRCNSKLQSYKLSLKALTLEQMQELGNTEKN